MFTGTSPFSSVEPGTAEGQAHHEGTSIAPNTDVGQPSQERNYFARNAAQRQTTRKRIRTASAVQ